jgi:hypothetical protein
MIITKRSFVWIAEECNFIILYYYYYYYIIIITLYNFNPSDLVGYEMKE